MATYKSSVKHLQYPQSNVYAKFADLSNLEAIRERVNDPAVQNVISSQNVSQDQVEQLRQILNDAQFTPDSLSVNIPALGNISINIVDREPEKCVKYTTSNSPVGVTLWIQVLPTSDTTSKILVTLDAELNIFLRGIIGNKLKDGVEKFADFLAMIPYN